MRLRYLPAHTFHILYATYICIVHVVIPPYLYMSMPSTGVSLYICLCHMLVCLCNSSCAWFACSQSYFMCSTLFFFVCGDPFVRIYVCAIYVCLCEFNRALFAWSQSRFICYTISVLYIMIPEYVFISQCHPSVCLDGSDRTFGSDRTLLACSQSLLMYDQYRYCMKYSSVHMYIYITSICMIS